MCYNSRTVRRFILIILHAHVLLFRMWTRRNIDFNVLCFCRRNSSGIVCIELVRGFPERKDKSNRRAYNVSRANSTTCTPVSALFVPRINVISLHHNRSEYSLDQQKKKLRNLPKSTIQCQLNACIIHIHFSSFILFFSTLVNVKRKTSLDILGGQIYGARRETTPVTRDVGG